MGAECKVDKKQLIIKGIGVKLPAKDFGILDMGNSGTAIRLLSGVLAGSSGVKAILTGDSSLMQRPMQRIAHPLEQFGAHVRTSQQGTGPLRIEGRQLDSMKWISHIASAQIKSSMIFAAMVSQVELEYIEPMPSRDHTERFLDYLEIECIRKNGKDFPETSLQSKEWLGNKDQIDTSFAHYYHIKPPYQWQMDQYRVPGDISSAAFFIVLASIIPNSQIQLMNVGLNPSRAGILEALKQMGGKIEVLANQDKGEPIGDIDIKYAQLQGTKFSGSIIPNIIDEVPILAVAAAFADGETEFLGVEELRYKESDRIQAICENLQSCGVTVDQWQDGFRVHGQKNVTGRSYIKSHSDHRIAMAFTILGLASREGVEIDDASWINTSFPDFFDLIKQIVKG